ncbi:TetR/AcrR family transcriptional regulator [Actinoplanes sp. M2I2]|uniref:TetR/AcrR family transcriptional regulator n=1 Tax=Actinoplanes sp. M2I2 TaxID=1734444 RepID=UPI002021E067|nr:TetR/AcrR family transcriptional regulator [Actinoplanes sp. M2I2]
MPSSQRRARERASTRDRIIEAALHVLENDGSAALTIRRIATDVEYSAPVVYQHFANKEALVLELVAYGHGLLLAELQEALGESGIDQRMLRIAAGYVRFAGAHPHLYEVMNGTAVPADERRRAAEPAVDVLKDQLITWSQAHDVMLTDLDEACEIIWGTVYGLASLGGLGTIGNERAQRLAEQAVHAILLGWRTGTPLR